VRGSDRAPSGGRRLKRNGGLSAKLLVSALVVAAIVTAGKATWVATRRLEARRPPAEFKPVPILEPPDEPISSEASVFRTSPATLAIWDFRAARRPAKPRTMHLYRTRRAYPGAPPQIPHGLTGLEFRAGSCTTCHQRGGYSPRFGAYVPVTPHPEMGPCLQCHVGVDGITGVTLPTQDPNTVCRQCHDPNAPKANPPAEWATTVWPQLRPVVTGQLPPVIPHDLALRGNCLACHAGPAAVQEIRTTHPERTNCRQCHVAIETDGGRYSRPASTAAPDGAAR
jgi:cytochrome c-type protein NapB